MLLVLLTAENCGNNSGINTNENRLNRTFQDIEENFVGNELSADVLSAFEKRAVQKLKDITDYMNIYGDSNLSKPFREQASQLIKKTFYEPDDLRHFYNDLKLQEDTLNRILCFRGNIGTFKADIDSVFLSNNLRMTSFLQYRGEIQFSQSVFVIHNTDTIVAINFPYKLEILVLKTKKKFGDKTEEVWEVYLEKSCF
jgi:hypothetical protein